MFGSNFNQNNDNINTTPKTGNGVGNFGTIEDDIDLIFQIGYLAWKIRNLSTFYNNFNLENPFSSDITDKDLLSSSSPSTANVLCRKTIFENLLIKFYQESLCVQKKEAEHKLQEVIMSSGNSFEKLIQIDDDKNVIDETLSKSPKPKSNRSTSLIPSLLSTPSDLLNCTPTCRRNNSLNDANLNFPSTNVQVQIAFTESSDNTDLLHHHRGSIGLLPNNAIGRKSTIILSKSCSNVDGSNSPLYTSSNGSKSASGFVKKSECDNFLRKNGKTIEISSGVDFDSSTALLKLKNTIIQCQFDKDDINAIIIDLKRKVEYTERMNWLYLSRRPMGPPHRKTSLPKHTEVKKRFLEICDTTFSEEVKSALRLPAFDSYEWEDAEIIHLMQTMFCDLGFIDKFNIPMNTLREWLYEVYKHYNEVPFHNFRHCFCVAQMMYAITKQANLISRLGELECLILLVSCICHDLDHPGYNNIYQINARTELALRYNDISPLENHHCSIAFRLLEHPECNIFKNFGRETFNIIREGIIRCILATDMARHNEILTQFKEVVPFFDYTNRAHINLLCMILIKVADISNEARPMDVAEPWLDRLLQEFFAQSAAEKTEGLPVTPFMDPDKISRPGSQVRFIGLVILPLFEALGELLPDIIELIIIPVRIALDYYKRLNDAQNRTRKSLGDNAENNSSDGGVSPQLPRSQSGISVKSRRSIPSQKSASRTSVDEPTCIAAELHDLPEGSESGDSETATEVDVAEKTSKFKVDTESSNRSKSSHSNSRKSSREKRPSMIGELCSTGGNRIRSSYGNIHGYHQNRHHFSSNRAVSLDQYSYNNRRLSDALPQVISDSNVFYNRCNRGSIDTTSTDNQVHLNSSVDTRKQRHHKDISKSICDDSVNLYNKLPTESEFVGSHLTPKGSVYEKVNQFNTNGNCSKNESDITSSMNNTVGKTWKARFRQISEYFSMSFDKGSKRLTTSTRNTTMSMKNNNTTDFKNQSLCSTISNNLSPSIKPKQELINAGRNRAYSLDVPSSRNRNSSSSGGGDSRKSSRNEDNSNRLDITLNEDNNSNNTSSGDVHPSIRLGGVDGNESIILSASSMPHPITPNFIADINYCGSIESGSATEADVIIPSGYNNPSKI